MGRKRYISMIISVVFIFFFYLSFNTPLTGDDWTWGTDRGLLRLQNLFYDYNGRYLSNILEIVLTRNDILRYLFIAFFSTCFIYLISRLYDKKDRVIYSLLAFILLLLMPANMFSQTLGWTAGYVNYVVSLVLLLTYLVIIKNIYESTEPTYPKWLWILLIPLGISSQLLVEHVSIFIVIIALYVIIYSYVKFKRVFIEHIVYFISVIIGSIIMFSNTAYINVLSGTDSYRTIKDSGTQENISFIKKIYNAYIGKMHEYIFFDSMIVNVFIGVMIVILIFSQVSDNKWVNFIIKPYLLFSTIGPIMFLVTVKSMLGYNYFGDKTDDFEAIVSLIFFVSVLLAIITLVKHRNSMVRLLLYFSGVVLLTAPFVFITPYGPRAALASYLFLMLIGFDLFNYNKNNSQWSETVLRKLLLSIAVILIIFYSIVFTRIGTTNRERLNHLEIEVANESEYIELTELPHAQFLWMSSTERKHFIKMFKKYYNVPESVEIKFVPYYKEK